MEKVKGSLKFKVTALILIALICVFIISSTTTTLAYFKFQKVYEGDGNLPVLKIDYKVLKNLTINNGEIVGDNGTSVDLQDISYQGQGSVSTGVVISSHGNNISGYVRVKVAIMWLDTITNEPLNNTPLDDNNERVTACSINVDKNVWAFNDNYYYLTEPMEKDSEIVLFDSLIFPEGNLTSYIGKEVTVRVIAEIYQKTNLPEDFVGGNNNE